MPFNRPSLDTLVKRVQADADSRLPEADSRLRRSVIGVLARVLAGACHGLYGYLDWISKQILPDTAESEMLDRHGAIWGVSRKAASLASGQVTFSGTAGSVVPADTLMQSAGGKFYRVTAEVTVASGGTVLAKLEALEPGSAGNLDAATLVSLVSPVSGLQSQATVADGGISGGADTETDEALRARLIARIQLPPQGGCKYDFLSWTLEVAGVTRAWCFSNWTGLGTVGVTFVCDEDSDGLIPNSTKLAEVEAYLTDPERKPVCAQIVVFAPMATPLNLTISALNPSTLAVKAAIKAELADLIRREAAPGTTLLISHIREAISLAAGEYDHVLVSPTVNVTHAAAELAVMGEITWT